MGGVPLGPALFLTRGYHSKRLGSFTASVGSLPGERQAAKPRAIPSPLPFEAETDSPEIVGMISVRKTQYDTYHIDAGLNGNSTSLLAIRRNNRSLAVIAPPR